MSNLSIYEANQIVPMTDEAIEKVRTLEAMLLTMPQVNIKTDHVFHAGMYARTVVVPAGVLLTGALIKIATILIVSGNGLVYIGEETVEVNGYTVIQGHANRKQAYFAITETTATMLFPSHAETVEDAENEFTDEAEMLATRKEKGDLIWQE